MKTYGFVMGSAAALLGLSLTAPATAQNIVADANLIASVMQDAGYKAEIKTDDGGDPYISSGGSGYHFSLFFYGCSEGRDCKSVGYHSAFDTKRQPDLEKINEYARTKRWGRIYVDTDGDPAIEMDLDLEDGGMSRELFIDNLEYWTTVMEAFGDWSFAEFGATS